MTGNSMEMLSPQNLVQKPSETLNSHEPLPIEIDTLTQDGLTNLSDGLNLTLDNRLSRSAQSNQSESGHSESGTEVAEETNSCCSKIFRQFGGIFLTLLASMLSSSNLIMIKQLQKSGIGGAEGTIIAYSGAFFPSIPLLIIKEWRVRRNRRKIQPKNYYNHQIQKEPPSQSESVFQAIWPFTDSTRRINAICLLVQAFIGSWAIMFRYFALRFITVGDTAVISIGAPVIVTILAHFTLGEKTGVVPILMAVLALIGVGIISRPPILTGQSSFDTKTLIGTSLAFASMTCAALQTLIWRKIRGVHFVLQLMSCGAFGMAVPLVVALILNRGTLMTPTNWKEWLIAMAASSNGFWVTLFMVLALKIEKASIVSLCRTCDAIYGFIFQFVIFNIPPDIYSSLGGCIIGFGVLVTAYRKYREGLPERESNYGRKCWAICCCHSDHSKKVAQVYVESLVL